MHEPEPQQAQDQQADFPDWVERSQRTARRRYRMRLAKPAITAGVLVLVAILGWIFWFSLPNPVRWFAGSPSAAASSSSNAGRWSMLGYGANLNGYVPEVSQQPAGRIAWSQDLGPYTRSAPLVADGKVFVGGHFEVSARDADTGEHLWSVETPGPMDHALTIANNNLVFAGLTNHRMLALDRDTGEQVWDFKAHLPISASALVHDGAAYVTSAGNIIYGLDAQTGEQLWKHKLRGNVKTTPALRDGHLYAADDEGNLYYIDADNGRRRFRFLTAGSASGPPVVTGDAAYFPSGGELYAIRTDVRGMPGLYWIKRTWFQLWIWQIPFVPPPPAQRGERWRFAPEDRASQGVVSSPAIAEGVYYVGDSDGLFYARDGLTDAEMWRFEAGGGIVSSPIILGDLVYFGARDGLLYVLNRTDSSPVWTLDLGAPIELPPAYADGRLYVRTTDGLLHAVE